MIRANLLPPVTRGAVVFGVRLELSDLWRVAAAAGMAAVPVLLLWLGYGVVVAGANARVEQLDNRLAQMATATNDVGQLASDVNRLSEIDQDAVWLKRSGQAVALRLAYLGNAVPRGTWLDNMSQDRNGWHIDGTGANLEAMSKFLAGIAAASPGLQSAFTSITGSSNSSDYSFKATITAPTPAPVASVPPDEAPHG